MPPVLVPMTAIHAADAPTVLITGANRGIGLELARQYAARDWHVIATAPAGAGRRARTLAATHPRVAIETLDDDPEAIAALA